MLHTHKGGWRKFTEGLFPKLCNGISEEHRNECSLPDWWLQSRYNLQAWLGFPDGAVVKIAPAISGETRDTVSIPGSGRFPWSTDWQPSPVFLPGQRSLVGYNPWGHKELGTTKASTCNVEDLGSIPELGRSPGEGNGNPLQYSCLESPMDGGAWEAAVHGVAKSQTGLSNFTFLS